MKIGNSAITVARAVKAVLNNPANSKAEKVKAGKSLDMRNK